MTDDRVDEHFLDAQAEIDELLKLKMSEFKRRREAGLISREQQSVLDQLYRNAMCGLSLMVEDVVRAWEKAIPVLKEGMEFLDKIESMTNTELLELRNAAESDSARRRNARETGSQGGKERKGKRYAAKKHAYWKQLAAERFTASTPWRAAHKVADFLEKILPPGDAPAVRTVYPILRKDQSWRGHVKRKIVDGKDP
jgi:hypothetical protein